jgi:hypothetical protein
VNLFLNTMMKAMGMEVRFVDQPDPENPATTRGRAAMPRPCRTQARGFPIAEVARIGRGSGAADRRQYRSSGSVRARSTMAPRCRTGDEMHRRARHRSGGSSCGGNFDWEKHADRFHS